MSSEAFDPCEYILEQLEMCNHTELYQMCRSAGIAVTPSMNLAELKRAFTHGAMENNTFDSWRHGLTGFVFENWRVLEPQLTCPIKSKDPKSCFGCLDTQVTACLKSSERYEQTIRLHRK